MALAVTGRRGGSAWLWWVAWVPVATLTGIGLSELAVGAVFGLFYLVLGVVTLIGQILVGRGLVF